MFEAPAMDLVEEIRALDVMSMTPIEALNMLVHAQGEGAQGIKLTEIQRKEQLPWRTDRYSGWITS